jgi:TonB-dependent receptor-like protein
MALSPVRLRASISVGAADAIAFTRSNSPALIASMNAALSCVDSAIGRFYRVVVRSIPSMPVTAIVALHLVGVARSAGAQPAERPPLGATITTEALGWLPAAGNLFSILETAVPDVIADRIDTGGLSAGEAARVGAHGSTWTQTLFTLGDIDITAPSGSGTPLLVPGMDTWQRVDVATGLMPLDREAPGLAIALTPRLPPAQWMGSFHGIVSPPALNARGDVGRRPSIARLNSWLHGELSTGGPLGSDKVGAFSTMSATRSTHFERASPDQIDANLASFFVNIIVSPSAADSVRTIAWLQRLRGPVGNHRALQQPNAGEKDIAGHVQVAWMRQLDRAGTALRLFGGTTRRHRTNSLAVEPLVMIERLRDGPIQDVLDVGSGADTTWMAGARAQTTPSANRSGIAQHAFAFGVDVGGSSMTMQSTFAGTVGELINGIPARVWTFTDPADSSQWRSFRTSAFASDEFTIAPRITANLGVRFDTIAGSRAGDAEPAISWRTLQPRAGAHWAITDFWHIAAFGQYGRYGHRLPLPDLAYGDPTAPSADVYRWNSAVTAPALVPAAIGPLVQRVGPGTRGDPRFSAIDPDLRRPVMDELVLGFEARPRPSAFARLVAIGRREHHMVGVADIGVPESTYTRIGIPDMGVDVVGSQDDQILFFFNRSPSTFGADRYLLTNPSDDETSFVGADLTGRVEAKQAYLLAGITAGRSEALSANRGFGPLENDAAVLGEVYINPNARGHAQGRVFTERGYTLKIAGGRHFADDVEFAMIARYQDGQHFARLVIMEGLNQGAEAVRAFRNGRTRFTFSMTVDARVQKVFTLGSRRISAMLDAYNMFNQALEVEEFSVTGATSRLTSAVQPPRVIELGVRIPF